ncbi:hypothetical protein D918_03682 [Trichuris suis]|nr:hypothetical protein D918_03682 [Trichuris suis]
MSHRQRRSCSYSCWLPLPLSPLWRSPAAICALRWPGFSVQIRFRSTRHHCAAFLFGYQRVAMVCIPV